MIIVIGPVQSRYHEAVQ